MPFMTHPIHGATNVGSGEVAAHEANGWKISTHEEWLAPKLKAKIAPAEVAEVPRPKIGRPAKAK